MSDRSSIETKITKKLTGSAKKHRCAHIERFLNCGRHSSSSLEERATSAPRGKGRRVVDRGIPTAQHASRGEAPASRREGTCRCWGGPGPTR